MGIFLKKKLEIAAVPIGLHYSFQFVLNGLYCVTRALCRKIIQKS